MKSTLEKKLLGVWSLISCQGISAAGKVFFPYGEAPRGQLIYTAAGNLSVFLTNYNRTPFASEDISKASSEETIAAFKSFDCYTGRWVAIEGNPPYVLHEIHCAKIPNWVKQTHKREITWLDKHLILTTEPFEMADDYWKVSVEWEKAELFHLATVHE